MTTGSPAPVPTLTAIAGLVEALEAAADRGTLTEWGFQSLGVCVDWKCLACGMLYSKPPLPLMNMRAELPADMRCDRPKCLTVIARAALAAFRTRLPMAKDAELRRTVYEHAADLHRAARFTSPALPNDYARAALAALDACLVKP